MTRRLPLAEAGREGTRVSPAAPRGSACLGGARSTYAHGGTPVSLLLRTRAGPQRWFHCIPGTQKILTRQLPCKQVSCGGQGAPLFLRQAGRSSREKESGADSGQLLPAGSSGSETDATLRGRARPGQDTPLTREPRPSAAGPPAAPSALTQTQRAAG